MRKLSNVLVLIVVFSFFIPLALSQKGDSLITIEWPYQQSSQLVEGDTYELLVYLVDSERYPLPDETVQVQYIHEGRDAEPITLNGARARSSMS